MIRYLSIWIQLHHDRRGLTAMGCGLIGGIIVASVIVGFELMANITSAGISGFGHGR